MGLKWWFLAIPVLIAIGYGVYYLYRQSRRVGQNNLPLLVRSFRITELPEYQRALRLHNRIAVAALAMSIVVVSALIGTTLRPTTVRHPKIPVSSAPVDIMLCFPPEIDMRAAKGEALPALFSVLRDKVKTLKYERVGLTHAFYRAFPVTSDLNFVAQRLGSLADLAKDVAAKPHSDEDAEPSHEFTRYTDTSWRGSHEILVSFNDTLAMCALGLPALGTDAGRGKMIIYFGETSSFVGDDSYSHLMPPDVLKKTIKAANIQVNVIDTATSSAGGLITQLADETGGQKLSFPLDEMAGGQGANNKSADAQAQALMGIVGKILDHEPNSAPEQSAQLPVTWEIPDPLLQIALIAAAVLAVCRLGMRQ